MRGSERRNHSRPVRVRSAAPSAEKWQPLTAFHDPGVDDKPPETVLSSLGMVRAVQLAAGFIKPLEDFDLDVEDLDDDEYDYDADLQEEARALREKMREMRSLRYAWFVLRKEKVALILAKAARKIPNWKPPNRCERVVVTLPPPPPKSAVQKRIEARARQLLGL